MIPIRDEIQPARTPIVTYLLLAANLAVFAWQISLGPALEAEVTRFAVVPARLVSALDAGAPLPQSLTIFSSMFLHGGIGHLLGNLWFLWIFGDNVEDRLGRVGFLAFYLICGVAAAISQVAVEPTSTLPMVGASGAIAGVLGAYLRLYPGARVVAVLPIFFFLQFYELPAAVFLGLWFLLQLVSSCAGEVGVAWWAHIAGFVVGVLLSLFARAPRPPVRRQMPRSYTRYRR